MWRQANSKQSLLAYAENRIGPRVPECDVAALALDGLRAAFESGASVDETFVAIANANRKVVDLSEAAKRTRCRCSVARYGRYDRRGLLSASGCAHLAHVGDGSIFRFRHGSLETLTTPHTLANEYRRKPGFTEADVAKLPANVILRALGMQSEVGTDRSEFETSLRAAICEDPKQ